MKLIKTNYRRGIAMIELIFALVIIGIVLLSAPMLIHQSSQSNAVALQQEAIAAISSHTGIILTKHWDEADANASGDGIGPILQTTAGDPVFDFALGVPRAGMVGITRGRLLASLGDQMLGASVIGMDPTDILVNASDVRTDDNDAVSQTRNDVDDYHQSNTTLSIYNEQETSASEGDYVDVNLNMDTAITYVVDSPTTFAATSTSNFSEVEAGGTSNIKFIEVHLTSVNEALSSTPELSKNIILKAFSCNLGTTVPQGLQKEEYIEG